jgi:hypothetical protein
MEVAYRTQFVYPAKDATIVRLAEAPRFVGRVAVPPFDDQRGNENSSGTMWLYAIPLMPYGYIEYDRPDAARMFCSVAQFEFTPTEDLAKAAAYLAPTTSGTARASGRWIPRFIGK